LERDDTSAIEDGLRQEIEDLNSRLSKQEKVINALKDRVKRSIQKSADSYAIFERNIVLQDVVQKQTSNLQVATQKAEAGNKAKSDFLANMSHEIRTPLNVITGMAHLVLKTELTSQQQNYIRNIQNSSRSLLAIINDILDLSKIEAGKLSLENIEFSIDTILENLSGVFGVGSNKNEIEILFSIDPTIPKTLIGDPLRLGQVLSNLCSNAVKFTHRGQIILGIEVKELKDESVSMQFSVEDTGVGINLVQSEKLFQAFSQADDSVTRKYGGTGLGLSICKHLVSMMGGEIWFESEQDKGSTFFFSMSFPIKEKQTEFNYKLPTEINNKNVLIIDDNKSSSAILINILKPYGLNPVAVSSGEEAIDKIKAQASDKCPYSIIFVDYTMPGLGGIETIERISEHYWKTAHPVFVLMITGNDIDEKKAADKILNNKTLLIKPFIPSTVIHSLSNIISDEHINKSPTDFKRKLKDNRFEFNQSFSVLVVDDNALNVEIVTEMIEDMGLSVSSATNGYDAIDMIKENKFDIVLMDIQMPDLDGLETTRIIRSNVKYIDLPILAMTAHAMEHDVDKSFEAGMDEHITKPIDPQFLKKVLIRILTDAHGFNILSIK
jgi:two-component system, sensor histidine kinase and response regulator